MKKVYIQPKLQLVKLYSNTTILAGSVRENAVSVSETNYDPESFEDY